MTNIEMKQIEATIANLNANTAKLLQETTKMKQETAKMQREIFWYPLAISSGLILAIGTIIKYLG
jgi:hypothetical protein